MAYSRPSTLPNTNPVSSGASSSMNSSLNPSQNGNPSIPLSEQIMQHDQAITLMLQEIDANFARAHQTITARILPSVKKYGVASARTWQGARFWKHFFEVSADVSLSSHADGASTYDENVDQSREYAATESQTDPNSPSYHHSNANRGGGEETLGTIQADGDDSLEQALNAGSRHLRASSPPNRNGGKYIQEESPFERLKNEVQSEFGNYQQQGDMSSVSQVESIINQNRREKEKEDWNDDNNKGKGRNLGDYSESAIDSPPQISGPSRNNRVGRTSSSPKKLLNKVLTAEQRKASGIGASRTGLPTKIQATTPRGPARIDRNPFASQSNNNGVKQGRDSLDSNPSPNKWNGIADLRKTPLTGPSTKSKSKTKASSPKKKSSSAAAAVGNEWDSDSDEDGSLAWPPGMSPPVTMQFSVPRSKYLKTPAKEAAKMVVEDLLRTVGGTSPALREREKREKELKMSLRKPPNFNESSSTSSSRLLSSTSRNQDVGGKKSPAFPSGPVNTPLKKSTKEKVREIRNLDSNSTKGNSNANANRRRDSMPTPPSITRHISVKDSENSISSSSSNAPRQSTTPSVAPGRQTSVVPGSVASNAGSLGGKSASSKLMDQDEDGADEDDDDDEVPENLGTKLSKVALGTSSAGVDKLLEYGNDSDESSDSDSSDSEEEEEEVVPASASRQVGSNAALSSSIHQPQSLDRSRGFTGSSVASHTNSSRSGGGRSIDQDTLFGVKPPSSNSNSNSNSISGGANAASQGGGRNGNGNADVQMLGGKIDSTFYGGNLTNRTEHDETFSPESPTPAGPALSGK